MVLGAIDGGLLLEVVWSSLLAGVFVTVLFSLVVLFSARSAEARRGGRGGTGAAYATLAVVSMALFAVAVGYGVTIMLSKG
jgi:hypothetical protein